MYIKKKRSERDAVHCRVSLISNIENFFLLNKIQLVEALANDSLVGECGARAVAG